MSIASQTQPQLSRRELHHGWTMGVAGGPAPSEFLSREIAATVPGVVHTDLLAAGLIPDPYLDNNESALAWIGLVDWRYSTKFSASPAELAADRVELAFDGLDTVATVTLNGKAIGEVANQHRSYRFDVKALLLETDNLLEVVFRSPLRYANQKSVEYGARPRPYAFPFEAIRKSACNFGWDWGIATFTSGIWRPVRLEAWTSARLAQVLVVAEPNEGGGRVAAHVTLSRFTDSPLLLELEVDGAVVSVGVPSAATASTVQVELPSVELWWPAGHGLQPLYQVVVRLRSEDGILDETQRRVGFRSVEWDSARDEHGHPFQLVVNGRPIWVKGANWIPDDAFFTRVNRARVERRLTQAVAANLNLIRVWGGGIYESDDFYDLCDELGLLTWQDFLFACAAYPEEEPLRSEVAAEARDNVARLQHHASLVLFTGNNENLWGYEDWNWKQLLDGRTWGALYYYELLPQIVNELAAHVAYSPGSPFSPDPDLHPNDESAGTTHLWEHWNRLDWPTYREHTPRFVAEFGWQGPPTWTTLTRAVSDSPLTPESPGMIVHQKAIDGNVKLSTGLIAHYRVPQDMETWHWAMQLNQANAVGFALDHFRSHTPKNSGAVIWQLNDCWPVTSWAAIDGDGREKPLFFALQNSFAPRVITMQQRDKDLVAVIVNDSDEEWQGELRFARDSFDGGTLAQLSLPVVVAPRATHTAIVPPAVQTATDVAAEVITASIGAVRGVHFFTEPRDSALREPEVDVSVAAQGEDVWKVTVTAKTVVRDITLLVDKLHPEATVDSGLVTLLVGDSAIFTVTGIANLTVEEISADRILRSGNQLVAS